MASEPAFEIGHTYFAIFYADEALRHPLFETMVYLGLDESEAGGPLHLFQYAGSFHADGNWNQMSAEARSMYDEPPIFSIAPSESEPMVDGAGFVEELKRWQARLT